MTTEKNEKTHLPTVLSYGEAKVSFELKDGSVMVNAAEMARPFKKKAVDWLKTKQTQEFLNELKISLSDNNHFAPESLIQVQRGGQHPGTWMHEDIALEFARWLSPKFAIWTNQQIKQMLKGGQVVTPPNALNQEASYSEGHVYVCKLGRQTTHSVQLHGEIFTKFAAVARHLGYESSPVYYVEKLGNNIRKYRLGKNEVWFINLDGVQDLLKMIRLTPSYEKVGEIFQDVFNVKRPETPEDGYSYRFTDSEILDIVLAVNRKPFNRQVIIDKLLKGKL